MPVVEKVEAGPDAQWASEGPKEIDIQHVRALLSATGVMMGTLNAMLAELQEAGLVALASDDKGGTYFTTTPLFDEAVMAAAGLATSAADPTHSSEPQSTAPA